MTQTLQPLLVRELSLLLTLHISCDAAVGVPLLSYLCFLRGFVQDVLLMSFLREVCWWLDINVRKYRCHFHSKILFHTYMLFFFCYFDIMSGAASTPCLLFAVCLLLNSNRGWCSTVPAGLRSGNPFELCSSGPEFCVLGVKNISASAENMQKSVLPRWLFFF